MDFRWQIALMRSDDFPLSEAQCDWYYQRSGTPVRSPYRLSSGWFEQARGGPYEAPNWVAEAGRDLVGESDESIRIALPHAALREGRRIGDLAHRGHCR